MGPFSLAMIYVQQLKDHLVLQRRQIWGTFEQASKNFFLTAIWLSDDQLWAIIVGTASLTQC